MKVKIYICTFRVSSMRTGDLHAQALIRKDGDLIVIANHISSTESFARQDMITSGWKNKYYDDACGKDNWEIVDWIGQECKPEDIL